MERLKNKKRLQILVAGASGYVGGLLVPELLHLGHHVRCLARNPAKLLARNWNGVEIVAGDVLDIASLQPAFQDIDIAYYLVHSMGSHSDFEKRDREGAGLFGKAAQQAGIQRIIYLGGLAPQGQQLSPHLESRQQVGTILAQAGVPVTELRASIIIGAGSASFEIIRDLASKLPVMITPRWVKSLCEPIYIDDVLHYLTAVLSEKRTVGQVLEIGGGEVLNYREMMKSVAREMGKRILILPVPVLTPHLSSYWLNIVTTVPMSIAYPLVEGLRNDSICVDRRIREWIPFTPVPFQTGIRQALERDISGRLTSRWTEASVFSAKNARSSSFRKILQDRRIQVTQVAPAVIFQTIQSLGGETGWLYANWAWKLRGALDRAIGGVGMRRGRRDPLNLRVGDAIDFWRVENFQPEKHLKLKAEMKLPGEAWLEFKVDIQGDNLTRYQQIATFIPSGWIGFIYWYIMLPAHFSIFRNMARKIVRKSLEQDPQPGDRQNK